MDKSSTKRRLMQNGIMMFVGQKPPWRVMKTFRTTCFPPHWREEFDQFNQANCKRTIFTRLGAFASSEKEFATFVRAADSREQQEIESSECFPSSRNIADRLLVHEHAARAMAKMLSDLTKKKNNLLSQNLERGKKEIGEKNFKPFKLWR
ncbi:unnamed protein product [Nippostrongylus brasiliensis]|uniref:Uncharacterized protein n=1 Tax=Nippostrongylus brasiliensis TaxID=27835 RepID=A0A0N4XYT2_NIPBR|nr:unnamed protein product [Nippostrongylus brasiliensis]